MKRYLPCLTVAFFLALSAGGSAKADFSIQKYLNIKAAKGGSWSPDGKRIVYLSNQTGTYQVWQIPASGGSPRPLTSFEERVSFVAYSPTEDQMVFGMDKGGNERWQLYLMKDGGDPRRISDDPEAIHEFGGWSHDGKSIAYADNSRDKKYFDIYTMNLSTGKKRLVLQRDAYNEVAAWSWDDRSLVVSTWESNYNNDLTLINLKNLKTRHLTPHAGWAEYTHVVWPKKKKYFYLASNLRQEWLKLGKFFLRKKTIEFQDAAPWNTESLAISRDGRRLAYSLNVNGYSQPVVMDIIEKKFLGKIPIEGGVSRHFRFSPDGARLLFVHQSPRGPKDLWIYDIASQKATRLTHSDTAGIPRESFIAPEFVRYPSFDKLKVPGYLYLPAGMEKDGKGAVLIYAHGGPESQTRPWFSGFFQYLLSRDIAIFAPNVRGSDGYGKTYIHLDDKRKRPDAMRDYALAAEYLRALGYFDGEKIGIYGGSYGGYVVLAALSEYPELFACGISVVGISNFVTFLEKTGPWRRGIREAEYGTLAEDRDFLRSISPVHKADRIRSPLMIIQGANDPRVPRQEAEQMVAALKKNGLPVSYLLYDDEGHGLSKLKNRLDAYPRMVDFLREHLLKSGDLRQEDPDEFAAPPSRDEAE